RQQLGGLEVRANRYISIYAYLILLAALLFLLFGLLAQTSLPLETLIVLGLAASLATAYVSLAVFPIFQAFLEKRVLGIRLPYQRLPEAYSSRIAASASMAELLKLLEEEVFPSLLVRQYAFLQWSGDAINALLAKGVEADQLPDKNEMNALIAQAGRYLPPDDGAPRPWIRLVLTLEPGGAISGLWLLGRRDPDDAYHEAEIPILQSLADQTAIAASNLLHADRIRTMYQLDIDRHEQDRLRLALDLHDSVLNQLAALRMSADDPNLSPTFQQTYDQAAQRLREIVSDLRPPMLNYGLRLALEELVQDLMERGGNGAKVTLVMYSADERYPQNVETHLFRIIQEACENALRHANATRVVVSARLEPKHISLSIEDDGRGFALGERLELDDLLVNKHFGLAGMVERASLIGARASIRSGPQRGTRIEVVWTAPASGPA
ncbi:MAG: ATP-binding protein, partial [Chloroflexota bacterium]